MTAKYQEKSMKVGAFDFVNFSETKETSPSVENKTLNKTVVHISSNENYKGCYVFDNE